MKKHMILLVILVATTIISEAQLIKTQLILTVRDEVGNTVEGATVKLFETDADYTTEKNPVFEGVTDKKGVVKFKNMKSIPYFAIVRKGDKDNAGGGEKIEKLVENKFNKATIVIQ